MKEEKKKEERTNISHKLILVKTKILELKNMKITSLNPL